MIEEIASIMAPKTGVLHNSIRRNLDAGKQTPESRKAKQAQAKQYKKRNPDYVTHEQGIVFGLTASINFVRDLQYQNRHG